MPGLRTALEQAVEREGMLSLNASQRAKACSEKSMYAVASGLWELDLDYRKAQQRLQEETAAAAATGQPLPKLRALGAGLAREYGLHRAFGYDTMHNDDLGVFVYIVDAITGFLKKKRNGDKVRHGDSINKLLLSRVMTPGYNLCDCM